MLETKCNYELYMQYIHTYIHTYIHYMHYMIHVCMLYRSVVGEHVQVVFGKLSGRNS